MDINEIIEEIDEHILDSNPDLIIHKVGIAQTMFVQSENGIRIVVPQDGRRVFSLETSDYDLQVLHLFRGGNPTSSKTYGYGSEQVFDLDFVLIILSRIPNAFGIGFKAINSTKHVQLGAFNADTPSVLKNTLNLPLNKEKGYSPDLFAYSFSYKMMGIRAYDFTEAIYPLA